MQARRLVVFALAAVAACSAEPSSPSAPDDNALRIESDAGKRIVVMSRNMYVGADLDEVIGALATPSPDDDRPALMHAIRTFQETDYDARVKALAAEIAEYKPDAVGLQEVSSIDIRVRAEGGYVEVRANFLEALMHELAEKGVRYRVAVRHRNFTVSPFEGTVRLTDEDVLLVRSERVTVLDTKRGAFRANVGLVAPGVEIRRGWVYARVRIEGLTYRIASTHPESGAGPQLAGLRAAQVAELIGLVGREGRSVIMGDLNDGRESLMYGQLLGAGYRDAWATLRPGLDGMTCCHQHDLANATASLTQYRDYVFVRNLNRENVLRGEMKLTGWRESERLWSQRHSIWPSDHAGVVGWFPVRASEPTDQ